MTADQFFAKYNNKPVNPDGAYGNQCVDLARQYAREVLGTDFPPVRGAVDMWNSYPAAYFDRITNIEGENGNHPIKGDVVIWGIKVGEFGHVNIAVGGDANHFDGFDQNWPAQYYIDSKGNQIGTGVCHYQSHNYFGVLGWLRPKNTVVLPDPVTPIPPQINLFSEDEKKAVQVLADHFDEARDLNGYRFGNLEGYANTLAQDAYKAWHNPPTPSVPNNPTPQLPSWLNWLFG